MVFRCLSCFPAGWNDYNTTTARKDINTMTLQELLHDNIFSSTGIYWSVPPPLPPRFAAESPGGNILSPQCRVVPLLSVVVVVVVVLLEWQPERNMTCFE